MDLARDPSDEQAALVDVLLDPLRDGAADDELIAAAIDVSVDEYLQLCETFLTVAGEPGDLIQEDDPVFALGQPSQSVEGTVPALETEPWSTRITSQIRSKGCKLGGIARMNRIAPLDLDELATGPPGDL